MSGGHFDYKDSDLRDTIYDYGSAPTNQFEDMEISYLVWDTLELIHAYDWYASGDTGKEDWLESKAKFKEKWLKNERSKNLEKIIDDRVNELKSELLEML